MRKIREILRLKYSCNRSNGQIAKSLNSNKTCVGRCLNRAKKIGFDKWPLPKDLNDSELDVLLYPSSHEVRTIEKQTGIDLEDIHKELKRKGVTLFLLWEEYRAQNYKGYGYSYFCLKYKNWREQKNLWMPQIHKAGEKMFVDYAGMTVAIINRNNGSVHEAQIFVAVLGASTCVYIEATMTQKLPDWIGSHCRAFAFYKGVPEIVVVDNLKSGIKKAHRYEPEENPTYQEMAAHYGVVIMAARVRKPQDKSLVEQAVQQTERQILAPLRDQQFFSIEELNKAIKPLLEKMNKKPLQKISGSRWSHYEELDKPALGPLPTEPYEFANWSKDRVDRGYSFSFGEHTYSVPHRFANKKIEIKSTQKTIEVFHKGERIVIHKRGKAGSKTILPEHMPKSHRQYAEWTPEKILTIAEKIGNETRLFFTNVIEKSGHLYKGARICLGIIRFEKSYGKDRLNAACKRADAIGGYSLKSVESILKNGLDQKSVLIPDQTKITDHENIRGNEYYK